MSFYVAIPETWPCQYYIVEQAPAKGYRYVSAPPFIVHSKLGGSFRKPQPFVVRGVSRDELLVQKIGDFVEPDCHENYRAIYADGSWHTINFDYTTEGYRFVRTVRKAVELLVKLMHEAQKTRTKAAKAAKDFEDRGERCGTCPCCFGDYIVHVPAGLGAGIRPKKMVHHGYERPGIGYIVGDCHGVGFLPFEISCEGTKSWVNQLHGALNYRKEALRQLDIRDDIIVDTKVKRNFRTGRTEIERKTIKRGEDGFDRAIEARRRELLTEIPKVERDIVEYGKKIAEWKPQPWPRQS